MGFLYEANNKFACHITFYVSTKSTQETEKGRKREKEIIHECLPLSGWCRLVLSILKMNTIATATWCYQKSCEVFLHVMCACNSNAFAFIIINSVNAGRENGMCPKFYEQFYFQHLIAYAIQFLLSFGLELWTLTRGSESFSSKPFFGCWNDVVV